MFAVIVSTLLYETNWQGTSYTRVTSRGVRGREEKGNKFSGVNTKLRNACGDRNQMLLSCREKRRDRTPFEFLGNYRKDTSWVQYMSCVSHCCMYSVDVVTGIYDYVMMLAICRRLIFLHQNNSLSIVMFFHQYTFPSIVNAKKICVDNCCDIPITDH